MSAPAFQPLTLRTIASGYIPDSVHGLTPAAAVRGSKARTPSLLTLAWLLVAAPATAQVNYAVSGGTAYVTSSPNASGDIVIVSTYNGHPVTYIASGAFSRCTNLTNVIIGRMAQSLEPLLSRALGLKAPGKMTSMKLQPITQ